MNKFKQIISLSVLSAITLSINTMLPVGSQCSQDKTKAKIEKPLSKDIVDTAQSAGSFNTLVTALKEAKLVNTLKGDGPFTVFAPTDEAFKKIPSEDLNKLLKDKAKLTKVLTYHVVPGSLKAKDVIKASNAKTVEGSKVPIVANKSGVTVGGANVVKTDILCSNGIVHVIDTVIMPADM